MFAVATLERLALAEKKRVSDSKKQLEEEKKATIKTKSSLPSPSFKLSVENQKLIDNIQFRARDLSKELEKIQASYPLLNRYYSSEKLLDRIEKTLKQEEKKLSVTHTSLPWNLSDWKIVDSAVNPLPAFIQETEFEIHASDVAIQVIQDIEELNLELRQFKSQLISAIRTAAINFGAWCNEEILKKMSRDKVRLDSLMEASKLFYPFITLRYEIDFHQLLPLSEEDLDSKSLREIFVLFEKIRNEASNPRLNIEKKLVIDEIKSAIAHKDVLKDNVIFHQQGGIEIAEEIKAKILRYERLQKKYEAIKLNYAKTSKSIIGGLSHSPEDKFTLKIKALRIFLDTIIDEYEEEVDKIEKDLSSFKADMRSDEKKKEMEVVVAEIYQAEVDVRNELETKDYRYATFINFEKTLITALEKQQAFGLKINAKRNCVTNFFSDIEGRFGKECKAKSLELKEKLSDLKETKLDDLIHSAVTLKLSAAYQLAQKEIEKERMMKQILQFLQEQILSDDNMRYFWSRQTYTFCGIGGVAIQVANQNIKVPEGIALLKERLKNVDITSLSIRETESLLMGVKAENGLDFDGVKGIVIKRKQMGRRENVRQDATHQFYTLIEKITQPEILSKETVAQFEKDIKTLIIDRKNLSKLRIITKKPEELATAPIAIPLHSH